MRGRWRWLPLGVLVALVVAALVIGSHHAGASSPSARATRIESEVRCPQCEGQSALESDAPAARAVRTFVSQQIQAGQSDGQIEQALVDRYGSDITLRPSATGITGLVWILPIAAFGIAAGGLTLAFRRWRSATELRPSDADRALVADALHDRDADADGDDGDG